MVDWYDVVTMNQFPWAYVTKQLNEFKNKVKNTGPQAGEPNDAATQHMKILFGRPKFFMEEIYDMFRKLILNLEVCLKSCSLF